ncbi:Ankyrin repeat and fibronectin type-III domain-containing protein 1 [Bagarius yarrelli]|uniref:Ankyrin repeat and fibronectin type-III domain-containing protein 1 n=1 Tax=Bagarius yarrelli TaxID=175774 RepID=A0A556UF38_BAGYA|nr:Ankyrin repeat and fibronectin type-III domain-containing protein 1 [Bagarius yarrelli]
MVCQLFDVWAESKMTQRVQEHCPSAIQKYSSSSGSSPPNAARRLYRNLSGKFRLANTDDMENKEPQRKADMYNRALFEAVEQQDLDLVESLLRNFSVEELDLNTPNSEGLLPLDVAILTNNVPMAKLLLQSGARESPHFVSPKARAVHLVALVKEAELRVSELVVQVKGAESTDDRTDTDIKRQLKAWDCVRLSISSSSSLKVHFQEPLCLNAAIITKYRVVWSSSPSFSPLLGEIVVEDTTLLQCEITGLRATQPKIAAKLESQFKIALKPESQPKIAAKPKLQSKMAADPESQCQPGMGLYIACVFYKDDHMVVTAEEQLPVMEVDDSYSNLTQDFLWFTKALFGTQDLGQVYFEPLRDKHGNALLVLLRDLDGCSDLDTQRWSKICKIQVPRKSTSCADEPTALDTLLITLQEKLFYHKRSRKTLSPGLYLGYIKLSSSVEQIRVLVPQKIPNVFCHVKIRDNSHVSREEWQWLQSVRSLNDTQGVYVNEQNPAHRLLLELRNAANDLLGRIDIPNNQYCRVSASLDLESLISQQALREAFSESEILSAKQRHQKIQELLQLVAYDDTLRLKRKNTTLNQVYECLKECVEGHSSQHLATYLYNHNPPALSHL